MGGMAWYLMPLAYGSCFGKNGQRAYKTCDCWREKRANLVIFQTEVRHTSHGGSLAFCQVLVNLVDTLGDVVVRFVEEFGSVSG